MTTLFQKLSKKRNKGKSENEKALKSPEEIWSEIYKITNSLTGDELCFGDSIGIDIEYKGNSLEVKVIVHDEEFNIVAEREKIVKLEKNFAMNVNFTKMKNEIITMEKKEGLEESGSDQNMISLDIYF